MTVNMTRVRVNRKLADEAMRVLGVKSRTEAVRVAVRWVLGLDRPIKLTEGDAKIIMHRPYGTPDELLDTSTPR
jgi:Arc/MetJ family transcription regulator